MIARWTAARALAIVALLASAGGGCGDNLGGDPPFTAVSGDRLAVQWYRYTDGAVEAGTELYDLFEHTACEPEVWGGDVRCLPIADPAVFVDDECTTVVGRQQALNGPTHFWLHERIAGRTVPVRLFRSGRRIADPTEFYERRNGGCVGPLVGPDNVIYRELTGEVLPEGLAVVRDAEVGDGPIRLAVRASDDGMRLPVQLRDRARDRACTPLTGPDGVTVCAPAGAPPANAFADPSCDEPAMIVNVDAVVPPVTTVAEPGGCASFRATGPELPPVAYQFAFGSCQGVSLGEGARVFAVGPAEALPALARTVETVPGRRLQRVTLTDGASAFLDELLFDSATRTACRRHQNPDGLTRCLPAALPPATPAHAGTCSGAMVEVVALPIVGCEPVTFASTASEHGLEVHAIGAPVTERLFTGGELACEVLTPPAGTLFHAVGPALAAEAFLEAIAFGER